MRRNWIIVLGVAAIALLAVGGCWWLCDRSDSTAFLPARRGAEWIVDTRPPVLVAHYAFPARTVFRREFTLAAAADATISLCAFKTAKVIVNGETVAGLDCNGKNWKLPMSADVPLRAGTNEIVVAVTNNFGPPALWLRLDAENFFLGTDESWLASPVENHWLTAHLAARPQALPEWSPLHDRPDSPRRAARELFLPVALALVAIFFAGRLARKNSALLSKNGIWLLLAAVLAARVALFSHDAPELPRVTGFDAAEHEDYIRFIQEKKRLPLPDDGWEMHQPPLYYLGAALWLDACGLSVTDDRAVLPLRAVNCAVGLLNCWLVLLCLRRLFPKNLSAQATGLLLAAFLPANLYPAFYVTNDPLAGMFVTLAFYFFLRWLELENGNFKFALGLGLALGAAALTKLNSLLAVPVLLAVMVLRLFPAENFSRRLLRDVGLAAAACALLCGWHYARVWVQIGALPLPNSQTDAATAWWEDPGFRTADYYLGFGRSLVAPLFSGLDSFADGIYSTLWADGLVSGASRQVFRPPWNYDLMAAAGLLAVAPTIFAAAGFAIAVHKFFRTRGPLPFVLAAMPCVFAAGIFFLTLRGPWLAHVKAFYALPALVPFCVLVVSGWTWLAEKNRAAQTFLWLVTLAWVFTVFDAFWIRGDNFELWRTRALVELRRQNFTGAARDITRALALNSGDVESHCILAETLNRQGKPINAGREYAAALNLQPDSPAPLDFLAQMLAAGEKDAAGQAVKFATRACELTAYRELNLVSTLAAAAARAEQWDVARSAAQTACELAAQSGNADLLQKNRRLLELCRAREPAQKGD